MSSDRRTVARIGAVAAATLAAAVVWVIVEPIGGLDLRAPAPGSPGETHDVGLVAVLLPSFAASVAGWGLLALLERFTARARVAWTVVAVVVLVLSLGGPLPATGITAADQLALASMHLAVAATLIPLLARTSPTRVGASGGGHDAAVPSDG